VSETEVADGAGAANRRFAVAVDDWNAATGRGRRNPEQDRRSRVGTPEKRTGLWDRIAAQRLPGAAEDTESDTTVTTLGRGRSPGRERAWITGEFGGTERGQVVLSELSFS